MARTNPYRLTGRILFLWSQNSLSLNISNVKKKKSQIEQKKGSKCFATLPTPDPVILLQSNFLTKIKKDFWAEGACTPKNVNFKSMGSRCSAEAEAGRRRGSGKEGPPELRRGRGRKPRHAARAPRRGPRRPAAPPSHPRGGWAGGAA